MKKPSKYMPAYKSPQSSVGLFGWLLLGGILCIAGYLIWNEPWVLGFIPVLMLISYFEQKRRKKKFAALQEERAEEGICEFARSFERHAVDTWVVRAVYEQMQEYVAMSGAFVPLRAADNLTELLEVDSDDLDMDLVEEIAQRTGRSLENMEQNPFTGKVETVGDLVHFFNAQSLAKCT